MNKFRVCLIGSLVASFLFLTGCVTAPKEPIPIDKNLWTSAPIKVGVYLSQIPKVETSYPGAGCLLCLGVAASTNSALSKHIDSLKPDGITDLEQEVSELLHTHNTQFVVIHASQLDISKLPDSGGSSKNPKIADKNYSSIKKKFDISHLLVVKVFYIGAQRPYSMYVPVGPPVAILRGVSYLVNLDNNNYEFYNPVTTIKSTDGTWDEPPNFPAMTNAFYQALEGGKEQLLSPLK